MEKTDREIKLGTLLSAGTVIDVRWIKQSSIVKCPFTIFDSIHYREDGSCLCNDATHRKTVMRKWGYTKRDFKRVGLE